MSGERVLCSAPTAPFGLASHREVLEHLRDAIFVLDRVDADGAQIFCVVVGGAYVGGDGELRVTLSRVYLDDHEQWTLWGGDDYVKEEYTVSKMTGAYLVSRSPPHVIDVASVAARYHDGDEAEWTGPWTGEEHQEFLHCRLLFDRDWDKFAKRIKTRSVAQIRSYARELAAGEGTDEATPKFAVPTAADPTAAIREAYAREQAAAKARTEEDAAVEADAAAAPQLGRSVKRVARADFENWLADRKVRWRTARGYVANTNAVPKPKRVRKPKPASSTKAVTARRGVSAPPRPRDGPFATIGGRLAARVAATKRATTRGASAAHAAVRREITTLCHEMTEAVDLLVSPQLARQEIRTLCRSMTEEVEHLVEPAAESAPMPSPTRDYRRLSPCGRCAQCLAEDCGECVYCLDMRKRGGPHRLRERCIARRCAAMPSRDARPGERAKRQRSDAAPPPDESSDDEAAAIARVVGWRASLGRNSRVWALFEPDVWWGGTIVSMSGAEDKRACSIVFDDATSQTFYARDVWQRPPAGGKVGARSPNAAARAAITKAFSIATGVTRCTSGRPDCYCKTGRTRAIVRYDPATGEDLEEYCSRSDAARKLQLTSPNITAVLSGGQRTTGGHAFRYKAASSPSRSGDLSTPRPKPRKRPRRGSPDADAATRIRAELVAFLPANADYLADIAPSAAARVSSLAELAALPADALDAVIASTSWKKLKANALRRHLARFREERSAPPAPRVTPVAPPSMPPRPKPRKRPKRGFYAAYAESSEPAPTPAPRRKKKPVAPSGNCPICYETLSADATVFECSHAMCASCSGSYATAEVARSMSRRSGVSVTCPLCRAPSKVALPEEMHTSVP